MADIKCAKACAAGQDEVKAGGWTPVNPTDPQVIEIGKFTVDAYNHKHQQQKLVFVKVEKGWSQILSGINYKLVIAAKNEKEVAIFPPPQPQLYQSVVFDPASGEMELVSFEKLLDEVKTGGWTPVNPIDTQVIEIGKFAVDAYNHKHQQQKLVFVKVEKGWSQIVSGINYKLVIAAKNEKEVAIFPPPQPQLYQSVVFDPASGEMELVSFEKLLDEVKAGGWTPVNPTDPQVIEIGKFAVDAYNHKHQQQKLVFVKVEKGWSQIVSGINYKLVIAAKNEKEVAIFPPPQPQLYQSVVFDPASGEMELVSFEKLLDEVKPGGWTLVNPTDPQVKEIGKFAVDAYNHKHQQQKLVFVKVEKGWSQIVSGINYKLVIAAKNEKEVAIFPPPQPQLYQSVVFDPASGKIELVSFEKLLDEVKAGGWTTVNPTDPQVIEIGKFAVDAYNHKHQQQKLVFVKVEKGWSQIVSGVNYKLIIAATNQVVAAIFPPPPPQLYQSVVFDPASGEMELVSFEILLDELKDGGWTPVNPTDPQVIEIGKFAVDAYNHNPHHRKLIFVKVEMGWSQIVSGINYKLIIAANNDPEILIFPPPEPQLYQAVVFDPASGEMELVSFENF